MVNNDREVSEQMARENAAKQYALTQEDGPGNWFAF